VSELQFQVFFTVQMPEPVRQPLNTAVCRAALYVFSTKRLKKAVLEGNPRSTPVQQPVTLASGGRIRQPVNECSGASARSFYRRHQEQWRISRA